MKLRSAIWILLWCSLIASGDMLSSASNPTSDPDTLLDMSLNELMEVEIGLTSKKEEKLFTTPAAAYVITAEDIKRSGATNLPELLRMVPGLQAAQVNGSRWAISSRGFNNIYSNKLLVMIDQRSSYSPLFGGTYWEMEPIILEDIERIEVIRGPGGTLWGANAVNGVINIITKSAADTQGVMVSAAGGSELLAHGVTRYGGKLGDNTYFRLFGQYLDRDDQALASGAEAMDGFDFGHSGFRIDSHPNDHDTLTIHGSAYDVDTADRVRYIQNDIPFPSLHTHNGPYNLRGGHLLGHWRRQEDEDHELSLLVYYDRTARYMPPVFDYIANTLNIDFHYRFVPIENHELTWGAGYTLTSDRTRNTSTYSLEPDSYDNHLYSSFIQDKITLFPDRWFVTVGAKLEHNSFTGFECQPSGRLLFTPDNNNTFWASVSRAVHTPSRNDRDSRAVLAYLGPNPLVMAGNNGTISEELLAYEVGYRTRPTPSLMLDLAAFFNDYDHLHTLESRGTQAAPILLFSNNMSGEVYGFETAANWQACSNWRLKAGYSFLDMQLHPYDTSSYQSDSRLEHSSPANMVSLGSLWDITKQLNLDSYWNFTDALSGNGVGSWMNVDLRLGWQINPHAELDLVGQNLLDDHRRELNSGHNVLFSETQRAVYARITLRF